MLMKYDIIIIGGGVIGCSIAYKLSKYKLNVCLIDKEYDVSEGISKANSGVLHAGFNVNSNTLKSRFNVEGLELYPQLLNELGLEFNNCQKLVIAKNDDEVYHLKKMYQTGLHNGVKGLNIINSQQVKKLQPNVNCNAALLSSATSVISPYQVNIALAESSCVNGVKFYLGKEIVSIEKNDKENKYITTDKNGMTWEAKVVINSAGMYSDIICNMLDESPEKIYSNRGEYYILDNKASEVISMAIYPIPPKDGTGLGVHLTPTMHGNVLVGPSADYINSRSDVSNTRSVMDTMKKEIYSIVPKLKGVDFIKNYSGLRPKLFKKNDKKTFMDFQIFDSEINKGFINLIGIESPGLTAAPAIADYVTEELVSKYFDLIEKEDHQIYKYTYGSKLNLENNKFREIIKIDKRYARFICRCENISEGDIIEAINNPLGVKTLNGIKRRTRAMMGRCQSGYCLPEITKILINQGIEIDEIRLNNNNSGFYDRN